MYSLKNATNWVLGNAPIDGRHKQICSPTAKAYATADDAPISVAATAGTPAALIEANLELLQGCNPVTTQVPFWILVFIHKSSNLWACLPMLIKTR
jgi:hypothetical protein